MTMLAYHNDPAVKDKYIARMRSHMEADALIQGKGWDGYKGCAVGCTFETYDHSCGPVEIGVPEPLVRLEDAIFEGLPEDQAKGFPLAFLEAIQVGADLSLAWPRFAVWLLSDPQFGVLRHCNDATRPSVETVIGLYHRWIDGDQPSDEEFEVARAAAWAARETEAARAAAETAWAAAWAAAGAAEAASWAAAGAAQSAAWAAAEAASWAAKEGFWIAARDELLRLLSQAPVAAEA